VNVCLPTEKPDTVDSRPHADLAKRQDIVVSQPENPVRQQCLSNCYAQQRVCTEGGHGEKYCSEITLKCMAQCWMGKRQVVTVFSNTGTSSPARQQCRKNCFAQDSVCIQGGHAGDYCTESTKACLAQCPSKKLTVEKRQDVVFNPPNSPVRQQCLDNCNAQRRICLKGGHLTEYCRTTWRACNAQCAPNKGMVSLHPQAPRS
jgi:hypothetical protein